MTTRLSDYACDECKRRKAQCSREPSGCRQCVVYSRTCLYSRSGIIRRKRKRKNIPNSELPLSASDNDGSGGHPSARFSIESNSNSPFGGSSTGPNSFRDGVSLDEDVESPFARSHPLLPGGAAQFWQDTSFIEMAERMRGSGNTLFTFEEEASLWIETFVAILKIGQPNFSPFPPEILANLATQPEKIDHKAYLVIFYGIMLTELSSDSSCDETTRTKLRWNLWICVNGARLLLEPSDISIEALMLLAFHVQDFHTPSLCWMLFSSACRMLQALGVNTRSLDDKTRKRRNFLFWFLNCVDKCLALIFERPAVFPRAMCRTVPKPTFQQLTEFHPHTSSSNSLFGAHIVHSMCQVSDIMDDIWSCLFSVENTIDLSKQTRRNLDDWYATTNKSLEASFLAEEPLLEASSRRSLELGITHIKYEYLYLTVLLTRADCQPYVAGEDSQHGKGHDCDCVQASRQLLYLLDNLVSDSRDVYNGIVWQLLLQPFTPFFALLDHIRIFVGVREQLQSEHGLHDREKEEHDAAIAQKMKRSVNAMECLSKFLEKMMTRHPLAKKLCGVATEQMRIVNRLVEVSGQKASGVEDVASVSTPSSAPGSLVTPVAQRIDPLIHVSSTLQSQQLGGGGGKQVELCPVPDSLDASFQIAGFDWFEWDHSISGY